MGPSLETTRIDSFPAVALSNDTLRVVVIPELGGKIISLMSRGTGREWLWRNPLLPLRLPPPGSTNFGMFDSGGWDEIFPTVNPCRVPDSTWGDRNLTDHGELWYRPWKMLSADANGNAAATLALAVEDADLPFRFQRTLSLASGTGPLTASYELTNRTDRPLPYIWAAHPLLAIEPGDTIHLPRGARVSSTGQIGIEFAPHELPFAWPNVVLKSGALLDLSKVPAPTDRFAVKLFAEDAPPTGIQIGNRNKGESIRLSAIQPHACYIGLWLNYGAWSGANTEPYFNAGIEPTTSPYDDLSLACQNRAASELPPRQTHRWRLTVTASTLDCD
jgi:galactose mutarotase-like enzyme